MSVVVAAVFWTWIWDPIGLELAMPLTLLLVVLGRDVPAFEVFDILLGDTPAPSPAETFFRRVLAGHVEEAIQLDRPSSGTNPLLIQPEWVKT